MDSKGNIVFDPTPAEVEEKKLIEVSDEQSKMPRRLRRQYYREYAKAQECGPDSVRMKQFRKRWGLDKGKQVDTSQTTGETQTDGNTVTV